MTKIFAALLLVCFTVSPFVHADDAAPAGKTLVIFIAGKRSHGFAAHEFNAGCLLLSKCLKEGMPDIETKVYLNGWPKDANALDGASAVVMYCDGGPGHMAIPHIAELEALAKKGVGIGCMHYAVEVPKGDAGSAWFDLIGGYFETFYSVNPVWKAQFTTIPQLPVTNGVKPFSTTDEWYYHMRFRPDMEGVTPVLSAVPPDSTRSGKDDAHGGNPFVRADIGKGVSEIVLWTYESKADGHRGFGLTGGHFHWNWANDEIRKCVLNTIVWIAKDQVPADGVNSTRPTLDDLLANEDKPLPPKFDRDQAQEEVDGLNK
jgi:type 1 glutamine amidotransferase